MASFGDFESCEELSVGPVTAVYLARRAGGAEPASFVLKVLDLSQLVTEVKDPAALVGRFIAAAQVQQRAASSSSSWAPIHALGEFSGGAYYVTDRFEHSLHRLIRGRVAVNHAKLHCLFSQIVKGLLDLQQGQRRAHGNLKPSNVLLRTNRLESPGNVLLSDPLPELAASDSCGSADVEAVGRMLYALVVGHEFTFRTPWPIESTPEWAALGGAGRHWRWMCDQMLNPNPPADLNPQWVADQLQRFARRRPWVKLAGGAAIAAAAVAVAAPLAIRHNNSRNSTDTGANTPVSLVPHPTSLPMTESHLTDRPQVTGDVLHDLMRARNPAAQFNVQIEYRTGDCDDQPGQCMYFTVTADRDCSVILLEQDSGGEITMLLPNAELGSPQASKGRPLHLPVKGSFPVVPPWGRTTFKVIATSRPLELDGASGSPLFGSIKALRDSETKHTATNLAELLPADAWTTAETTVTMTAPAQAGLTNEPATAAR